MYEFHLLFFFPLQTNLIYPSVMLLAALEENQFQVAFHIEHKFDRFTTQIPQAPAIEHRLLLVTVTAEIPNDQ
jgi:hypothetical protein